jgi:hydroxylamine reductase
VPPKTSYSDRIFTTDAVGYPGAIHIIEKNGRKDFTPLINKALELGGWAEEKKLTGINGGSEVMTGFARNSVLSVAGKLVEAVKDGAIRRFLLVGGCDGAKVVRSY